MSDSQSETHVDGASGGRRGQTFRAGDRVASRYRIVGFLGEGGMGEVYEAHDEELDERVALKIIRPAVAGDARMLQRFKREIQLARRVTHPNISRIFDVSHHLATGAGAEDERRIAFVSMELIRGMTLSRYLERTGRLAPAQALPIIEQMVAGLAAAHALGIVHRDFKSPNVMVVPSPDGGTPRVVVTDFGLAMELAGEGERRTALTEPGRVMGTPDYMAPEQVEGLPVTPATDVYALGIVMYEMLTGRLPFGGVTPMAVALSRLRDRPPSPRQSVPNLDPQWEQVVLRCLEREPERRFSDVRDVVLALRGARIAAPPASRGAKNTRAAIAVAGALLLVAIVAARLTQRDEPRIATPAAAAARATATATRPSFAVLGFHNLSNDAASEWIGNAFTEMLTTELAAGETLRAVPGERVAQVKSDLGISSAAPIPTNRMALVRSSLAADLLVSGAYLALPSPSGRRIRVDVRVQDARSGQLRTSLSQTGEEAEMIELIGRVGNQLRTTLGSAVSNAQLAGLRAAVPADERVAREYAEGLARLRQFDARGARPFFERAIALDPKYPLAHSALAQTLWTLGYENDARAAAKRALDLATNLEREQRLDIEGRYYEYTQDWPRAIDIMRSLYTFYPDEVTYGVRLATVQMHGGQGKQALQTLAALRKLPPPLGEDPNIDLVEAEAANQLADYPRELAAAARAKKRGEALGARLVIAHAEMNAGFALRQTDKPDAALAAYRRAQAIFHAAGDEAGVARARSNAAVALADKGDFAAAIAEYTAADAIQRKIGAMNARALTLLNMANVMAQTGELERATATMRESLSIASEVKSARLIVHGRGLLGAYLQLQGDTAGAQRAYEETIAAAKEANLPPARLDALTNLAELHRLKGELAPARVRTNEALALARELKVARIEGYITAGAAQISLLEGKLEDALREQQSAIAIYQRIGLKSYVAEARMGLAAIALARGDAAMAEREASLAVQELAASGARDYEALARVLRARALLQSSRAVEARAELARVAPVAEKTSNAEVKIAYDIAMARLDASRPLALRAAAAAKKAMLLQPEFEARLAAAEIRRAESREAGDGDLRALARDAESRGVLLYRDLARRRAAS